MKNNHLEDSNNVLSSEEKEKWELSFTCAIVGPYDLLPEINSASDEQYYRNHYINGVLQEIIKLGTAIKRWGEFFSGKKVTNVNDTDALIDNLILQAIIDEQNLWQRKLLESLLRLILFSGTNENQYFEHYLLYMSLDEIIKTERDWKEFYECPSLNYQWQKNQLIEKIVTLDQQVFLPNCWYLRSRKSIKRETSRVNFTDYKALLKDALPNGTSFEKYAIGFTYQMYSESSQSIHFTSTSTYKIVDIEKIKENVSRISALFHAIIIRCQDILGNIPPGINQVIRDSIKNNPLPDHLFKDQLNKEFDFGEYVITADGAIGQVVKSITSDFGYKSYKIKYVANKPLPEIEEEYYPAQFLKPFYFY